MFFRTTQSRSVASGIISAFLTAVLGQSALADGTINGHCWMEKIKGRPGSYNEMYEWNFWMVKDGNASQGQCYRVGLPPAPSQAYYTFTFPAGSYSALLDQPLFLGRPAVFSNITIPGSGTVSKDFEPPSDYHCAFGNKSASWGDNPWTIFGSPWYQTFMATGTSITGVSFKLAGTNATAMTVTIHQDNGGNVTTWPQVGISRVCTGLGPLSDNWIRYRSGEIPTTPGLRYALKLTGQSGLANNNFAIFRRIEDGQGYAGGQAYDSAGQAQNFDLYAMIFSDSDGTVIPYVSVLYEAGSLIDWSYTWWQEIKAIGNSLAGAGIFFAGGTTWDIPLDFRVRIGGPQGQQVGPKKTGRGAYQASSSGFAGASWNPGEVPLTPGQVYFLEVSGNASLGSIGFTPYRFTRSENAYAPGKAWWLNFGSVAEARPDIDLLMQVVEYVGGTPPSLQVSPTQLVRNVVRGQNLASDTFTIRNTGGGLMSYSISENSEWLSVNPTSGDAAGETDIITITYNTSSLAVGPYSAVLTVTAPGADNSPRTVTINLTVTLPPYAPVDFDQDGDVDHSDFGHFQVCLTGPGTAQTLPACLPARLDNDEDVDLDDFGIFQRCFSGPGKPANVLCAD